MLGHAVVGSGELHEESDSLVEDSISSYWINPVSIKCKF